MVSDSPIKIFISYAHPDSRAVRMLISLLQELNRDVWYDSRLIPGQNWDAQIKDAIKNCDCFVYALTPHAWASTWCQWEFSTAVQAAKRILLVLIQDPVPLPHELSLVQYVDFRERPTFYEGCKAGAKLMEGLANSTPVPRQLVPEKLFPAEHEESKGPLLPEPFEWISIPPGTTMIHLDTGYVSPSTGDVPTFDIAKYPVTNAQYQVFLDAPDGYADIAWWRYDDAAQDWRIRHPKAEPVMYAGDDLPRAHLSWYDALAYCRWLSSKLDQMITLPTEAQWQRAAQGDSGSAASQPSFPVYPWGNSLGKGRCNARAADKGADRPLPVTHFAQGQSPYGVMDMIGNVSEWTLTACDPNGQILEQGQYRIVKGGSWESTNQGFLRIESRTMKGPKECHPTIGFRIVRIFPQD